jgi:hypothetical protein
LSPPVKATRMRTPRMPYVVSVVLRVHLSVEPTVYDSPPFTLAPLMASVVPRLDKAPVSLVARLCWEPAAAIAPPDAAQLPAPVGYPCTIDTDEKAGKDPRANKSLKTIEIIATDLGSTEQTPLVSIGKYRWYSEYEEWTVDRAVKRTSCRTLDSRSTGS